MLRNIIKGFVKFNFAKEVAKATSTATSSANLTYYKEGQLVNRTQLVLKKK
jgi:hypothetical protein